MPKAIKILFAMERPTNYPSVFRVFTDPAGTIDFSKMKITCFSCVL